MLFDDSYVYNPYLGRWINRDPIREKGGLNLYEYVRNQPLDNIDPTGTDFIFLNDSTHPFLVGHAAELIGNDEYGWTYFAKNGIPSIILFTIPAALVALLTFLLVRVILYWRRGDRSGPSPTFATRCIFGNFLGFATREAA
jgi:hypothetical protein